MRRLILLLCLAAPLQADTLGEVKAVLGRLNAKAPIRATWVSESNGSTNGKFANDKTSRRISVEAAQDAETIRVEIRRGEKRDALSSVSPASISENLDFADAFTDLLNTGTLSEEKRVVWNGVPARLLVLQLKEPKREHEISIGKVTYSENRLNVWIGPDAVPLAAEHTRKANAGFLMFHGDTTTRSTWQFARKDDHFVVTRFEDWSSFSGFGQQGQTHTIVTVSVH
jgi:hypothetical protein